jgi:hypothetical protein
VGATAADSAAARFVGNLPGDVHVGVISDGRFSPLPTSLITTPTLYSPTAIAW